jgi:CubicO group peptidase (beta-lactamase class C family)
MRKLLCLFLLAGLLAAQPLPVSTPEREGLSPERLQRLHTAFDKLVKDGEKAGAISLLVRNGRIADWKTYGYRDIEQKLPMEKDTICRIWSMTKPVTSVAIMMLVEEGKIVLNDPVEKYIPEFKGLKVFKGGTAANPILAAPDRPMTVKHLITHTAGMSYGWENDVVAELYVRAKIFEGPTLKEFVNRMAKLPLAFTPGTQYRYAVGIDVLGYIVEVASDMPFDRFTQTRIFDPLKMTDTSFVLPESKKARLAKTYERKDGKLSAVETIGEMRIAPGVPFGGMGLYSTIGDYARFAQMLLNGGQLDGRQILGRKTVELMMKNHLNDLTPPTIGGDNADGFGLGGSVRISAANSGRPGSEGMFGWSGAATTWFRVDPKEKFAALVFMQSMPYDSATLNLFETLAYQTLVDPVPAPAPRASR